MVKKILTDKEIEDLIKKEGWTLEEFEEMKNDPVGKRIVEKMLKENVRKIEKALRERESRS